MDDILNTDQRYQDNKADWELYHACYKGIKALLKLNVLSDFKDINSNIPGSVEGFNYSKRIVEATAGFLTRYKFNSDYGQLDNDKLFQAFLKNCDLLGCDFERWFDFNRAMVCVFGYVGILVTQPGVPADTALSKKIHPYMSLYTPLNILKATFIRDVHTHQPKLNYIKLRQYNPDAIIEYTPTEYRTYIKTDASVADTNISDYQLDKRFCGPNKLGEIPVVVWAGEPEPGVPIGGESLLADIAHIDCSLVRTAARLDVLEHMGAFPSFVRAMKKRNLAKPGEPVKEVNFGPKTVQEFDPELPDSKPFWLKPEVQAAITPILDIWERKKTEMYELSYLAPVLESQGKEPRSGEALAQLFELLYSRLSRMASSEEEVRTKVIQLWAKWQTAEHKAEDVRISHNKIFKKKEPTNISEVQAEKDMIGPMSETAEKEIAKRVVDTGTLADISQEKRKTISDEIDKYVKPAPSPVQSLNLNEPGQVGDLNKQSKSIEPDTGKKPEDKTIKTK